MRRFSVLLTMRCFLGLVVPALGLGMGLMAIVTFVVNPMSSQSSGVAGWDRRVCCWGK